MSPLLFYVLNPLLTLHTILGTVYFCLSLESNLKKVGALPYIGVSMVAYVMVVQMNVRFMKYVGVIKTDTAIYEI